METEKKGGKFKRGIAIAVLIAMLGGAGYLVFSWHYFYWNAPDRKNSDMAYLWQWKTYATGMKQAYAEDPYGGATPEETLKLFVDALRAGDIELASKYYIPEKQEEVFHDLEKGKKNGNTLGYVEYLENRDEGKFLSPNEYSFSVSEGQEFLFYIRVVLNPANKKWKISEP